MPFNKFIEIIIERREKKEETSIGSKLILLRIEKNEKNDTTNLNVIKKELENAWKTRGGRQAQ